jgi:transposase
MSANEHSELSDVSAYGSK